MTKEHGNTGKRNAAKSTDESATSFIHARCNTADKAKWVIAAQKSGMKLTEWLIAAANEKLKLQADEMKPNESGR
jgi:hypothetical protein